jgi:hypothetical protein
MRLDTLSYSAMRWLAAAAAAAAFVVALSVQTVRGASISSPAVAAGVETAITSDSTPATVPAGGGRLTAVSVPALRLPVHHRARHHRTAPPARPLADTLVSTPAAAPAPTPVPVATAAPVVSAPAAPVPAPAKPAPKPPAPAHGPGFDSSG